MTPAPISARGVGCEGSTVCMPKSIGHYVLRKTIGSGTFGKVQLGTNILTGEKVAVKVLEKEKIVDPADVERVAREIHILKFLRKSRHVIQLYEIIETPRQLYLIMEYAPGGELFDYIVNNGRAQEVDSCKFLHQILAGLECVHSQSVVHRDLKPENLLLTESQDVKIADFGLSNTHEEGQFLNTACGSPCYAAPEMIQNQEYHPPLVDMWSCGVVLYALVCGYLPFEDQTQSETYRKICAGEFDLPDFLSEKVTDLLRKMLTTDPSHRLRLPQVREHPWYKQIPEASLKEYPNDPLEESILKQLDDYGFPREYSVGCLLANKHNHLTTTYYLLKEKQLRQAEIELRLNESQGKQFRSTESLSENLWLAFQTEDAKAAVARVATPSRGSRVDKDKFELQCCNFTPAAETSPQQDGAVPARTKVPPLNLAGLGPTPSALPSPSKWSAVVRRCASPVSRGSSPTDHASPSRRHASPRGTSPPSLRWTCSTVPGRQNQCARSVSPAAVQAGRVRASATLPVPGDAVSRRHTAHVAAASVRASGEATTSSSSSRPAVAVNTGSPGNTSFAGAASQHIPLSARAAMHSSNYEQRSGRRRPSDTCQTSTAAAPSGISKGQPNVQAAASTVVEAMERSPRRRRATDGTPLSARARLQGQRPVSGIGSLGASTVTTTASRSHHGTATSTGRPKVIDRCCVTSL